MPQPIIDADPLDWGWFLRTFGPLHGQDTFATYGAGGMVDPKNYTLEPYVISGRGTTAFWTWNRARWGAFGMGFLASQAFALLGVGTIGMIFDPFGISEDSGMDEIWGDVFDWNEAIGLSSALTPAWAKV